jgi:ribosomal protein S18 acetylase RimI-like enzyme
VNAVAGLRTESSSLPLRCVDWRALSAEDVHPLLAHERAAWRRELAWDIREAWRPVEVARAAGTLPGFVALDERGRIRGWTWFVDGDRTRQVGAIVADTHEGTRALVAALTDGQHAPAPRRQIFSVRTAAPDLAVALSGRDFRLTSYRYLCRDFEPGHRAARTTSPRAARFRMWRHDDVSAFADLCARAYADTTDVRAFAPAGTAAEWLAYARGLVETPGCGRLIPEATLVCAADDRLVAAVLTTDLGLGTAHIAQIAVDPSMRGAGVGRSLLTSARAVAARQGFQRLTLLVAGSNVRACRLYARAGLEPRADFLVAIRS